MHQEISRTAEHRKSLILAVVLTSTYLVAEVVGGFWTGSLALLADAGHMLTDVGGLLLSLLAIHFASRPATPSRTFGFYRAEILAALTNGLVLVLVSVGILFEAYERWQQPPAVSTGPMLAIAIVGLIVNLISMRLLRQGASGSLNVKGAYLEVMSDLLASIGVIAAAWIMRMTGWYWFDPVVSAGIGLFILPRTFKLMWDAVSVLLESTPAGIDLSDVRRALGQIPGVVDVHDLHVWAITSGMYSLTTHVIVAPEAKSEFVMAEVRKRVHDAFEIEHVTVQLEPLGYDCERKHD
jgi:cobalt-zinc-cadmium efflux system protein